MADGADELLELRRRVEALEEQVRLLQSTADLPAEAVQERPRRYLVVANQTLGTEHLATELQKRMAGGPSRFYLLVPKVPVAGGPTYQPPQSGAGSVDWLGQPVGGIPWKQREHRIWADQEEVAEEQARIRLRAELTRLRDVGAQVDGEVGDFDPLQAIEDVLERQRFDEIIVSTLPPGLSRWLRMDLPSRVERRFDLPVTHVRSTEEG